MSAQTGLSAAFDETRCKQAIELSVVIIAFLRSRTQRWQRLYILPWLFLACAPEGPAKWCSWLRRALLGLIPPVVKSSFDLITGESWCYFVKNKAQDIYGNGPSQFFQFLQSNCPFRTPPKRIISEFKLVAWVTARKQLYWSPPFHSGPTTWQDS